MIKQIPKGKWKHVSYWCFNCDLQGYWLELIRYVDGWQWVVYNSKRREHVLGDSDSVGEGLYYPTPNEAAVACENYLYRAVLHARST